MQHPRFSAAVLMQWTRLNDRWQSEKWEAIGVIEDEGIQTTPTVLMKDPFRARWLHSGYALTLYPDEAEGYYLNLTAPQPFVFVMWRMEDGMARPSILTLSYNEAAKKDSDLLAKYQDKAADNYKKGQGRAKGAAAAASPKPKK